MTIKERALVALLLLLIIVGPALVDGTLPDHLLP